MSLRLNFLVSSLTSSVNPVSETVANMQGEFEMRRARTSPRNPSPKCGLRKDLLMSIRTCLGVNPFSISCGISFCCVFTMLCSCISVNANIAWKISHSGCFVWKLVHLSAPRSLRINVAAMSLPDLGGPFRRMIFVIGQRLER